LRRGFSWLSMNEHGRVVRALVRPGVYLALKRGRWKSLACAYFWAVSPLVRFANSIHAKEVSSRLG